jgi:hypothetical protein
MAEKATRHDLQKRAQIQTHKPYNLVGKEACYELQKRPQLETHKA